jgi:hypothetical protein
MNITYSECVSIASIIQLAMRVRRIDICALSRSAVYFHIISLTARFLGNPLLNIKCVLWFSVQLLAEMCLILRRMLRDINTNLRTSSGEVPVILVRF